MIQNRTYPSAKYCRECLVKHREEYRKDYDKTRYLATKYVSYSVLFGMREVKQDANWTTVPVR